MAKNYSVIDVKPKNASFSIDFGTEQFFSVTVNAGQSMGLLLALTYKTGFTVQSSKTR